MLIKTLRMPPRQFVTGELARFHIDPAANLIVTIR